MEEMRGLHGLLRQTNITDHSVEGELDLNGFPNSAIHVSDFGGEDGAVFSYS
jgi:hypothetical protein